jgi:nicotinamidase/pyrazinamidase
MATYDERTALVVTDVQNDFGDPAGGLYVRGGEEVVPVVNGEIDRAASAGALIVYSQDWHPEVTPHFEKDGGIWPVHCVADTWGAELMPGLDVREGAELLRKGTGGEDGYSVFTVRDPRSGETAPTRLEQLLRDRGVERVVVVGLATDYCVKETALDALRLGFDTEVLREGIRAVDLRPGDGDRAVEEIRQAGGRVT